MGGLVGAQWEGNISNSYSTGNVKGSEDYVGGLIGIHFDGIISNSYSTGNVIRTSGTNTHFGGFVGRNYQGKIFNSYSTGKVKWQSTPHPTDKGFAGRADTGGNYEMSGNYWDSETSEQTSTAGDATAKTTLQMTWNYNEENTYEDWDFEDIWAHDTTGTVNDGYPYLKWQIE